MRKMGLILWLISAVLLVARLLILEQEVLLSALVGILALVFMASIGLVDSQEARSSFISQSGIVRIVAIAIVLVGTFAGLDGSEINVRSEAMEPALAAGQDYFIVAMITLLLVVPFIQQGTTKNRMEKGGPE